MKNEICTFAVGKVGFCKILVGEKCDGRNKFCSFRKTDEQFQAERDKAISLNRKRGNYPKCRYMMADFCRLSTEMADNFLGGEKN